MLYFLILTAITTLLVAYYCWSRRHLYAAASKIKGTNGLPLLGNALSLMGKPEGRNLQYKNYLNLHNISFLSQMLQIKISKLLIKMLIYVLSFHDFLNNI